MKQMEYVDGLLMIYEFHFVDDHNCNHANLVYIDIDNRLINRDIYHMVNMVLYNIHQCLLCKKDQL